MTDNVVTIKQSEGAGQARALGLFLLKRYEEAASVYDDLLKKEPDNIVFWINRIICRLQYSAVNKTVLDQMIKRVNDLPAQGYLCLAEMLSDFNRREDALVFVDKALEKDPENIDAYVLKADILEKLERADDLYRLMLSLYPRFKKDERILCLAAFYAVLYWNVRQATHFLKRALKANPFATLQNRLFYQVLLSMDEEEKIADYGNQALEVWDGNPIVWFSLIQAYTKMEQYELADASFETLSNMITLSESLRFQWVEILIREKKYDQAFDLLIEMTKNSETWLKQIRTLFADMRQAGLIRQCHEKANILENFDDITPEIKYVCDEILQKKDRKEDIPLSLVALISDETIMEQLDPSITPSYFGPLILEETLKQTKVPLAQSLNVLDLGCGVGAMGSVLQNFSRPDGNLTGVDILPVALEFAKEQKGYTDLRENDLLSFCKEKVNARKYDLIVCMNVLFNYSDLTPVFKAVKTALKTDGLFIFSVLPVAEEGRAFMFDLGRFYHGADFVRSCLKSAKLQEEYLKEDLLYPGKPCLTFAARKKK